MNDEQQDEILADLQLDIGQAVNTATMAFRFMHPMEETVENLDAEIGAISMGALDLCLGMEECATYDPVEDDWEGVETMVHLVRNILIGLDILLEHRGYELDLEFDITAKEKKGE